jgi:PKD repeat protein
VNIISNGTEGIAPATFEFEAEVSGGIEPYTSRWDFGDGSSNGESNTQTVFHTFDQAGRYNVGLIVIDSRNQIAFDSIAITVEEGEPPATEEGPNLDDPGNNSGSENLFDIEDLLDGLELSNNVVNIGGTSATDDYDATADD